MKKIALVLSGGGFKGAFQVGALAYLRDNWDKIAPDRPPLSFDIVAGVSVGSLNGLLVALNRFDVLEKLWDDVAERGVQEIYTSDFINTTAGPDTPNPTLKLTLDWEAIRKNFPQTTRNLLLRAVFSRKALLRSLTAEFQQFRAVADNTPLRNKLLGLARREAIGDTIFKCGFVSLNDGKYYSLSQHEFSSNTAFADGVLASTAMPIVWPPVEAIETVDGTIRQSIDGGIRDVSPLGDVVREIVKDGSPEDYTIIIINTSSGRIDAEEFAEKNIVQIALRALLDVAITEIFNNDIREFVDKNYILSQIRDKLPNQPIYDYDMETGGRGKALKFFHALIIQPEANVLGDTLTASPAQLAYRRSHGRARAEVALGRYLGDGEGGVVVA